MSKDNVLIYDEMDVEAIKQTTFKITKKMVDDLIKATYNTKIDKIKSPEDLQKLIEDL